MMYSAHIDLQCYTERKPRSVWRWWIPHSPCGIQITHHYNWLSNDGSTSKPFVNLNNNQIAIRSLLIICFFYSEAVITSDDISFLGRSLVGSLSTANVTSNLQIMDAGIKTNVIMFVY